jgi:hypothetical protein
VNVPGIVQVHPELSEQRLQRFRQTSLKLANGLAAILGVAGHELHLGAVDGVVSHALVADVVCRGHVCVQ